MINKFRLAGILLSSILCLLLFGGSSQAASQIPNGITVSPAFQEVSVPKDAQQQPVSFTITNNGSQVQKLSLSVADFNALNESGGLFFVGTIPTDLQKKYGLAKWMSLPVTNLTIGAKQTATVEASVLNLPKLQPGGHYGALMVSIDSNNSASANKVGLHPIASSLIFVTKVGGNTHRLSLSNVAHNGNIFRLPSSVSLKFMNNGNTHVIPRGTVSIVNNKNKMVSKGIINPDSKIILPEATRNYSVALNRTITNSGIGKYKLVVNFRFDGIEQYRSYKQSISYVPVFSFIVAVLIIVGLIILIYRYLIKRLKS